MSGNAGIISFKDVSYEHQEGKPILEETSFSVRRGSKFTLMGKNGAGKSTLAQIVSNLIQPVSGQVLINGLPFTKPGYKYAMDTGIRMVFQKLQFLVNCVIQAELLHHEVDRSDPASPHGLRPLSYFVVNVRCRHHRPFAAAVVIFVQPPPDPTLATSQLFLYLGVHSKTLRVA